MNNPSYYCSIKDNPSESSDQEWEVQNNRFIKKSPDENFRKSISFIHEQHQQRRPKRPSKNESKPLMKPKSISTTIITRDRKPKKRKNQPKNTHKYSHVTKNNLSIGVHREDACNQEFYDTGNIGFLTEEPLYTYSKLNKKLHNVVSKLEKYLKTFLVAKKYEELDPQFRPLGRLNHLEKNYLYALLRQQEEEEKMITEKSSQSVNQERSQESQINSIIKQAVKQIDEKVAIMEQANPGSSETLVRWKNLKMHQLQAAKNFLKEGNINQFDPEIDSFLDFLKKELDLLMAEEFYPELKSEKKNLQRSLTDHLQAEKFPDSQPEPTIMNRRITDQSEIDNFENYFTAGAVVWFMNTFRDFLKESEQFYGQILEAVNQNYGMTVQNKQILSKAGKNYWWEMVESFSAENQILTDEMFISYSKGVIGVGDTEQEKEKRMWMHIFNKAVADSLNQELYQFQPLYPCGEPLRPVEKEGKTHQWKEEAFDELWSTAMWNVYQHCTHLAGLIVEDPTQSIREYNKKKSIQLQLMDIKQPLWTQKELPIHQYALHMELVREIQSILFIEVESQLIGFF